MTKNELREFIKETVTEILKGNPMKDADFKSEGEVLQNYRAKYKFSRPEVSEKTDISVNTLCAMENGKLKEMSFQKVVRLAVLYDLDLNIFKKFN